MAVLNRLDINAEEESPLAYAEAVRAKSLIKIVEDSVRQGRAMLAFQPVVSSDPSHQVVLRGIDPYSRSNGTNHSCGSLH